MRRPMTRPRWRQMSGRSPSGSNRPGSTRWCSLVRAARTGRRTSTRTTPTDPSSSSSTQAAVTAFASNAATTDTSVLEGAIAGGRFGPDQAIYERMADCVATITDAGVELPAPEDVADDPDNQRFQPAFAACPQVAILQAWLEAAGEDLNYGTLAAVLEDGVEVTIPADPDPPTTFGLPPDGDGNPAAYLYRWDDPGARDRGLSRTVPAPDGGRSPLSGAPGRVPRGPGTARPGRWSRRGRCGPEGLFQPDHPRERGHEEQEGLRRHRFAEAVALPGAGDGCELGLPDALAPFADDRGDRLAVVGQGHELHEQRGPGTVAGVRPDRPEGLGRPSRSRRVARRSGPCPGGARR